MNHPELIVFRGPEIPRLLKALGFRWNCPRPAHAFYVEMPDRDYVEGDDGWVSRRFTRFTSRQIRILERNKTEQAQEIIAWGGMDGILTLTRGRWDGTTNAYRPEQDPEIMLPPKREAIIREMEKDIPAAFATVDAILTERVRTIPLYRPDAPPMSKPGWL
jgi:hypothetical protein